MIESKCHKVSWDDDEDENTTTKKRKSEVIENTTTTTTTKTIFSYFAQKNTAKNERHLSGSHFFRSAHLKPVLLSM